MAKKKMEVLSETVGKEMTDSFIEEEKPPEQPTTAIAEYSPTVAVLSSLKEKYADKKYEVATTAGMAEAVKARAEVRAYRIGLEKERVKIKAAVLERGRLIDSEAKRITSELEALENPIDEQIKTEEGRKEAEKQAKIEAERVRVENIQKRIESIRSIPLLLTGKSSKEIEAISDQMRDQLITEADFQEFQPVALAVYQEILSTVNKVHADVVAQEEEKARIIAERAELEKLRKEQAEREAEAEKKRIAEEAKLKAEREAEEKKLKAEREAEEKRIAAVRKAEDDRLAQERAKEEARIAKEREAEEAKRAAASKAIEDARKAEAQRIEEERAAEKERLRVAHEKLMEEQRMEAERQQRERAFHEAKMKAEREEAERIRADAEKREKEIAEKQAEIDRQRELAEEQAKEAALHLENLRQARRGSVEVALSDILELAKNEEAHPNAYIVRREIAIIAEANLPKKQAKKKEQVPA